jgi:hypothetical protein
VEAETLILEPRGLRSRASRRRRRR